MSTGPAQSPLDYRSGSDARVDDVRAMRRSVRTWAMLTAVWVMGMAVWAIYLAALGFIFLRWIS